MTNVFLSRTNHVGSPWLSRSVVSGRARHNRRNASRGSLAIPRFWHGGPLRRKRPSATMRSYNPDLDPSELYGPDKGTAMRTLTLVLLLLTALIPRPAAAWTDAGHLPIATVAHPPLTPEVRTRVGG